MGGRDLPVDCDRCGKVLDWGDFGPEEGDCTCEPAISIGYAVNSLLKAAEQDGWQIVSLEFRKPRKAVASELRAMADELDPPEGGTA